MFDDIVIHAPNGEVESHYLNGMYSSLLRVEPLSPGGGGGGGGPGWFDGLAATRLYAMMGDI